KDVLNSFSKFRLERDIEINISDIDNEIYAPRMPVAVYKGLFHNLYTNALKALVAVAKEDKCIKVSAQNIKNTHIVKVSDNGSGTAPSVRRMIWETPYTASRSENNPLGSGMGRAAPPVERIGDKLGGGIQVASPEDGLTATVYVNLPTE